MTSHLSGLSRRRAAATPLTQKENGDADNVVGNKVVGPGRTRRGHWICLVAVGIFLFVYRYSGGPTKTSLRASTEKSQYNVRTKNPSAREEGTEPKYSVLIGGAGYSGIAAANVLDDNGVSFAILDATERVGGRMWEMRFGVPGNQYTVETGAQWISGIDGNPAYEQAVKENFNGVIQDFSNVNIHDENGDFNRQESRFATNTTSRRKRKAYKAARKLVKQCVQLSDTDFPITDPDQRELCDLLKDPFGPGDNVDRSTAEVYFAAAGWNASTEPNPSLARLVDIYLDDFNSGERNELTSANANFHIMAYEDFLGDDFFVLDPRGFSWLPKSQAAGFLDTTSNQDQLVFDDDRLKNNIKVLVVNWDPNGMDDVVVTACKTTKVEAPNMPTLYPCTSDPFDLVAKDFISTFSLGVLQKSMDLEELRTPIEDSYDIAVRFQPPLSTTIDGGAFKNSAFKNAMGLCTKVFLQFDFKFWKHRGGAEFFLSAHSEGDYKGNFAPFWFAYDFGQDEIAESYHPGSHIISLFTLDDRARRLAEQPDDVSKAELLQVLNNMFEAEIREELGRPLKVNDIKAFHKTRWSLDPLFYGGWSNWRIGYTEEDQARISTRYGNLVFSGEHTCRRHYGYTHGAKVAGERSSLMLLRDRYGMPGINTDTLCDFTPDELKRSRIA